MKHVQVATVLLISLLPSLVHAQPGRKEIAIPAADMLPAPQRGDDPGPGRWWLFKGFGEDPLLLSGRVQDVKGKPGEWQVMPIQRFVPYKLPTIVIDPKATGWHRIYVGMLHDPLEPHGKLFARLSKDPYPEYLVTPENTKAKTVEVYW